MSDRSAALASRLAEVLGERTVAVAESCTAGAVASALAAGGDGQRWFRGSIVAYQDEVKRTLLGVRATSTVTVEAAREMAEGVRSRLGADFAAATTGVFGDEPVDGVEPTMVVIATVGPDGASQVERHDLDDDPEQAASQAVELALQQLLDHVTGKQDMGSESWTAVPYG